MIEITDLTKSFGENLALNGISFGVKEGEVVGFLGPNGAGKTTTMRVITGQLAPTGGQVKVAGYDVFAIPLEVKRRIGYLPENPPLYQDMYVRDYLVYAARLKGVRRGQLKVHVDDAIEKTHIGDVQNRFIGNLSKGFKQRVGMAQALVSNPELLVLDEPTIGLDPKQVAEIRNLIKELKGHHTVILSTHILPEVQATCEKIVIIHKGEIVAKDTLEALNQKITGLRRLIISIREPSLKLIEELERVDGVDRVGNVDGEGAIEIDVGDLPGIEEKIAERVVQSGCGLREMRWEEQNLEDIFLKLTSSDESREES
jgi:ABC-2 type transport system ATP-binding protein